MRSYIKEGAPYAALNNLLLMIISATSSEMLTLKHSHLWLAELCRHMQLYRNRESLHMDLRIFARAVAFVIPQDVVACNLKSCLDTLLASVQFWQLPIQQLCVICIFQIMLKCPEGTVRNCRS